MDAFWDRLLSEKSLTETDIVATAAWFLSRDGGAITASAVCDAIEESGIRLNINRSRLRQKIRRTPQVSLSRDDVISLHRDKARRLSEEYADVIVPVPVTVIDTVLASTEFEQDRSYVKQLVRQINGSYQQAYFDGCAVLMRRLMEVTSVDAFERNGQLEVIQDSSGDLKPLSTIVSTLQSGRPIKLGRGMGIILTCVKELGDRAAHNRRYITSKLDVDQVTQPYRGLITELRAA